MTEEKIEYFTCDCFSDEHTLRFQYDPVEDEMWTSVYLYQYRSFFKRVWIAIKYIFGYKCKFGHWDCFTLRTEDKVRFYQLAEKVMKGPQQ